MCLFEDGQKLPVFIKNVYFQTCNTLDKISIIYCLLEHLKHLPNHEYNNSDWAMA